MRLRVLDRAADAPAAAQAVRLDGVRKVYGRGDGAVVALDGVSAGFKRGSFTAVMGPSGSGKSTFLHMAAGLDRPTAGMVRLGGVALDGMSETRLTELRRERVGFVFQAFNLLPALTVAQNIDLPLRLSRGRADRSWRREVVDRIGLGDRLRHRPAELSGGQQQRLVGSTPRQVAGMARWEAALLVMVGLGLGAVIAAATLVPFSVAIAGTAMPYVPAGQLAAVLGGAAVLGLAASQLPTRLALRAKAVDAIGVRE